MHIYSIIRIAECLSDCLRNHVLAAHRSEFHCYSCLCYLACKKILAIICFWPYFAHMRRQCSPNVLQEKNTFKHCMVENEADIYSSYLDVIGICEEHGQSVHPHAPTCCWGQTILQCCTEVFIH